jgi:Calcineurin-like phosphoesterase
MLFTAIVGFPRNLRSSLFCSFVLGATLACYPHFVQAQSELKIGVVGDQTGVNTTLDASYQALSQGAKALAAEHVDGIIHVGDLVESGGAPDQIKAEFAQATGILDSIGKPWHLTAGDHDVDPPVFVPNSTDDTRKQLYYDLYHAREPKLSPGLWHSFDVGGYHFISLNSQERLDVDPRWGDIFLSRISREQTDWLKQDLEAHRGAKGIIVFLHQPLWYNWAWWAPVHALLRSYPVRAVIAGHFHYDQDEGEIDHIRYWVVGATGALLKRADRNSGGVNEVGVLSLRGNSVDMRLIPLDGGGPLTFTSRIDMDRMQALDVLLGNLYNFGAKNPLCVGNGKLYGPAGATPQLVLIPVGNPIDLPLALSVSTPSDSKFILDAPQFTSGACQSMSPAGECTLSPSSRVETSNNSTVVLNDNDYSRLGPLWQSGISVKQGAVPQVDDVVNLTVKLAFESDRQMHWITKAATTKLTACTAAAK